MRFSANANRPSLASWEWTAYSHTIRRSSRRPSSKEDVFANVINCFIVASARDDPDTTSATRSSVRARKS